MHKLITLACALGLAATWSLGLAAAADVKEKAIETKDTIKEKAVDAKDAIKEKAVEVKDAIKDKAHRAKEKMSGKSRSVGDDRVAMTDTRAAQEALKTQGFDPGPIDGRMGPRTRTAISDYQRKENLPVTGMLDDATMTQLNVRSSRAADVPAASPGTTPDPKKQNP